MALGYKPTINKPNHGNTAHMYSSVGFSLFSFTIVVRLGDNISGQGLSSGAGESVETYSQHFHEEINRYISFGSDVCKNTNGNCVSL